LSDFWQEATYSRSETIIQRALYKREERKLSPNLLHIVFRGSPNTGFKKKTTIGLYQAFIDAKCGEKSGAYKSTVKTFKRLKKLE